MANNYRTIVESNELTENNKYYWGYQFRLGKEVLVPYLEKIGAFRSGDKVMEIGCAEGGVLAAFAEAGAIDAVGTDIENYRLDAGRKIDSIINLGIEFFYHNIISDEVPEHLKNSISLVILRDVIEHLPDTETALKNIYQLIKPGGYLFLTFPPYHSPFGGHQHTLGSLLGKLPYIHLFPKPIFKLLIATGRKWDIEEVMRLHKIRMTPKKLVANAKKTGFSVEHQNYYLIRPVFKMRFGLPSINLGIFKTFSFIKNYFSLEALFLLKKVEK